MTNELLLRAARAAHEANRAFCAGIGDPVPPAWEDAPEELRQSCITGALGVMTHPDRTPAESHAAWMQTRRADGWAWGAVKNAELKLHPNLVPYEELPAAQQQKDHLFLAVVRGVTRPL